MRPAAWNPPVELSAAEQAVMRRIKRAKLFTFLRRKRHELFDAAFQAELGTLSRESERQLARGAPAGTPPGVQGALAVAHRVEAQDAARTDDGSPALRQGVAAERRISAEDAAMRHGRKSKSLLADGYKRHVLPGALRALDRKLILAVGITPANVPEATVTDRIAQDLAHQGFRLDDLDIDRAYLSSTPVARAPAGVADLLQSPAGTERTGWPLSQGRLHAGRGGRHGPLAQ